MSDTSASVGGMSWQTSDRHILPAWITVVLGVGRGVSPPTVKRIGHCSLRQHWDPSVYIGQAGNHTKNCQRNIYIVCVLLIVLSIYWPISSARGIQSFEQLCIYYSFWGNSVDSIVYSLDVILQQFVKFSAHVLTKL